MTERLAKIITLFSDQSLYVYMNDETPLEDLKQTELEINNRCLAVIHKKKIS